ncbi:hypothetical protein LEN26_012087 [Aphanomyces euteiches]|nr:hypothetical protein LEN26_012087 [Aphanomyces euteiches]
MRTLTLLAIAASAVVAFHQPHQDMPVRQDSIDATINGLHELEGARRLQWTRSHGKQANYLGHEASPSKQWLDLNRRLQDGKYAAKLRKGCGAVGAACGAVGGAARYTANAIVPIRGDPLSYGQRLKLEAKVGAGVGRERGREIAGNMGAKVGKVKDDFSAKRAAKVQVHPIDR